MRERPETLLGLIRHAPTVWNQEKRIQGQSDSPLTHEGENMARVWGSVLERFGWDRILASDLGRTRRTAALINSALNLPLTVHSGLREKDWGEWAGKTLSEIKIQCPDYLAEMEKAGWAFRPPGGEDRGQVYERSLAALEAAAFQWPGQRILVVTHKGVINCLVYRILGRKFLPSEPAIIADRHLHEMVYDGSLRIQHLNALALDAEVCSG
jgi:probable phosphoglycerate mutase